MTKSVFSDEYARFRELLVKARRKTNTTQQQLADKIGWTQTDISKAERGERRLDLIEFLAITEALNLDVTKFIEELQT